MQIRRLDYKPDSLEDIFLKAMEWIWRSPPMAVYERNYRRLPGAD